MIQDMLIGDIERAWANHNKEREELINKHIFAPLSSIANQLGATVEIQRHLVCHIRGNYVFIAGYVKDEQVTESVVELNNRFIICPKECDKCKVWEFLLDLTRPIDKVTLGIKQLGDAARLSTEHIKEYAESINSQNKKPETHNDL